MSTLPTRRRAEAQNDFGGWVRVTYRCEYDPTAKQVIDARIEPGRIRK